MESTRSPLVSPAGAPSDGGAASRRGLNDVGGPGGSSPGGCRQTRQAPPRSHLALAIRSSQARGLPLRGKESLEPRRLRSPGFPGRLRRSMSGGTWGIIFSGSYHMPQPVPLLFTAQPERFVQEEAGVLVLPRPARRHEPMSPPPGGRVPGPPGHDPTAFRVHTKTALSFHGPPLCPFMDVPPHAQAWMRLPSVQSRGGGERHERVSIRKSGVGGAGNIQHIRCAARVRAALSCAALSWQSASAATAS